MTADRQRNAREAILDAANTVVALRGVANLTFEEVARKAGVSKGGVLYHFPSKDALTEAMIARFIEVFDGTMERARADDPQRVGRNTRAYIKASMAEALQGPNLADSVNGSLTAALANYPERLQAVREQSARSQSLIDGDGLDPVFASIIRFAIDGMWLGENFHLIDMAPEVKLAICRRLVAWTKLKNLPAASVRGAPKLEKVAP